MKHITFGEKTIIVGDETADLMLEYATILANRGAADTVQVRGIGYDGGDVTATFLLDAGASMMAESTNSILPEPDNEDAITYMRDRIESMAPHPFPITEDLSATPMASTFDEYDA